MMTKTVIEITNVGKLYSLGVLHLRSNMIRESIAGATKRMWHKLRPTGDKLNTINRKEERSNKHFFWALRNISLAVAPGEVLGLVGANGAGKSTLLKILSRITSPTEGHIRIQGKVGSLLEVGTGFHPELTGRENIFLNGSILGMTKKDIRQKFDAIVNFAEIEEFIDTPVKRYSSGMYVRLAFAVAAHLDPDILLVDEVLAVGDLAFQKKCLSRIQEVTGQGRTVLFVSHRMSAIQTLCQKAVWIDKGLIVLCGPAAEVVRAYEKHQIQSLKKSESVIARSEVTVHNKRLYCSCLVMRNSGGDKTSIFSYHDTLTLDVDIMNDSTFSNYSIEFRIFKYYHEFVAVGSSGLLHGIYFNRKVKRIRINVGPLPLTNGEYSISLRLVDGDTVVDDWEHACIFHVVDCNPFPMPREITAPICIIDHSYSFK